MMPLEQYTGATTDDVVSILIGTLIEDKTYDVVIIGTQIAITLSQEIVFESTND